MGPHYTDARDVPVLDAIWRIFFHLGKYIADDAGVVIRGCLGPRGVDGNVRQLRPRQGMVKIVLERGINMRR